jgi:hypothetical protein
MKKVFLLTLLISGCVQGGNSAQTVEAESPFRGYTQVEICDVYMGRAEPIRELQARRADFTRENVERYLRERQFNSRSSCEEVYSADAQERDPNRHRSPASSSGVPVNGGANAELNRSRAHEACTRRARLAASDTRRSDPIRSGSSYTYCRSDYLGNYRCTDGPRITGGAWEGIYNAQRNINNSREIFSSEYEICMLELGF